MKREFYAPAKSIDPAQLALYAQVEQGGCFLPWKRWFRKMILWRLQTITSYKTITSITDICFLFSLQVKPGLAVRGVWNSKNGQNRSSSYNKVSAKERHDAWRFFALNCYRALLIHKVQLRLTFICSLNTNHTFLVTRLETIRIVEDCLRGQGVTVFREGIAMHEHRSTKWTDVKGGLY